MTRYRYRWNHRTGESYEVREDDAPSAGAQLLPSLEPYKSPVTGEVIRNRRQREKDLNQHGCIDAREAPSRDEAAQIRARNFERDQNEGMNHVFREYFQSR